MTRHQPVLQRVHKLLAAEGIGSRREIEEMIRRGEVLINGRIARLGDRADRDDELRVSGRRVVLAVPGVPRVIAYHKPCGEVVSRSEHVHRSVFAHFPPLEQGRWVTVGRLDVNTSGLLLACNDGDLAHRLMHPSYQIPRVYCVRVKGQVTDETLRRLLDGVEIGGRSARFAEIRGEGAAGGVNRWFSVTLREGRNREVRRLWGSQGHLVSRLIRTRFGTVSLSDQSQSTWRELDRASVRELYRRVDLDAAPARRGDGVDTAW